MSIQNWQEAETEILAALRKLSTEGGDGSFLIVSVGDAYVQFAGNRESRYVDCETVGNDYLPERRRLTPDRIGELERLGFDLQEESANFSRKFDLSEEEKAKELAQLTLRILEKVYGCQQDSPVEIQLTLE